MNDEALDAARAVRDGITSVLPLEIQMAIREIIDVIVSELGESPEAWRGCKVAIEWLLNRPILAFFDQFKRDKSEHGATLLMLLLGQFLSDERVLAAYQILREQEQQQKREQS